jgi:hypothetical protein
LSTFFSRAGLVEFVVVFVGFRLFGVWLGLDFLAQPLVDVGGVYFGLLDGLPDGGV